MFVSKRSWADSSAAMLKSLKQGDNNMIFEQEGKKFDIDFEKTKEYYASRALCDCPACRNFYLLIKEKYVLLNNFLNKFGVDIANPEEIVWGDIHNGELDCVVVCYTVKGSILETDNYEIDIMDHTFVSIVVEDGHKRNDEETEKYFVLSVYGIYLPYIIDEKPFISNELCQKNFSTCSEKSKSKKNLSVFKRFLQKLFHYRRRSKNA